MKMIQGVTFTRAAGLVCLLALAASANVALAAEPEHMDHPAVTREMRTKMAAAHEQMAACLKSDRPMADCHADMMKVHEEMEMHDCMHRMHRDHDHLKADQPPAEAKPK